MKKRYKLKRWVKETLIIMLVFAIGLLAVFSLCARAEQVNHSEVYYEK